MARLAGYPAEKGFSVAADFAAHTRCLMAWPENIYAWPYGARRAAEAYAEAARAISRFEPVVVFANDRGLEQARRMLEPEIRVARADYDDAWMRDIGPSFLTRGTDVRAVCWLFNCWGGLLPGASTHRRTSLAVVEECALDHWEAPLVLENGSIQTDGEGTLITTEECLLNPNRNPEMDKAGIEQALKDWLGISVVIWLPGGLFGDRDTNGHVDNLLCYVRPGEVALAWEDNPADPQADISREALEILSHATDARGRRLVIHKVPQPTPMNYTPEEVEAYEEHDGTRLRQAGERLAGSYVNLYQANGGVVMPGFDQPKADARALEIVRRLFPDRQVTQIPSRQILLGGGNLHCITLAQPASGQ